MAAEPDGLNINDGVGSTHIDGLAKAVAAAGADLGIAHDGDADRCLAVTADGELVDGDQILALCALRMRALGRLTANTVVATVMSNLGFHHAMGAAGIEVITTAVGDRYVLEVLREHDLPLGGEQSGHVVFTGEASTGDGLLTALNIMACVAESGKSLADLAAVVQRLPQVLINVRVNDKDAVAESGAVQAAVAEAAATLGSAGRVLLRPSGTEQLVRVMVEASSQQLAEELASRVAEVVAAS
jgi:phosphoglucosamine mutase